MKIEIGQAIPDKFVPYEKGTFYIFREIDDPCLQHFFAFDKYFYGEGIIEYLSVDGRWCHQMNNGNGQYFHTREEAEQHRDKFMSDAEWLANHIAERESK